jgi:hypothetical protein
LGDVFLISSIARPRSKVCEVEADAGRTGAYPIRSVCEWIFGDRSPKIYHEARGGAPNLLFLFSAPSMAR